MPEANIDYNALGQAMDTTWGRSSTPATAGYSVKFNLHGNRLIVTCGMMVNFGTEKEMILTKRSCAEESLALIKEVLSKVKKTYKDISGKALSTKESLSNESLEIVGFGVHNPKRTACYRRKTIFELG
jgi:hypothetical protein